MDSSDISWVSVHSLPGLAADASHVPEKNRYPFFPQEELGPRENGLPMVMEWMREPGLGPFCCVEDGLDVLMALPLRVGLEEEGKKIDKMTEPA